MDDTYLWSHDHKHLQAALSELANTGLPSTPRKRQSPTATTQGGIGGCRATCLLSVHPSPSWVPHSAILALVAETQRRGEQCSDDINMSSAQAQTSSVR